MQIILSPQRAQRTQSSDISLTMYEKAAASRFRTRMTRIARIFTDTWASASSVQYVFHPNKIIEHVSAFIDVMPAAMHRHVCPCGGIRGCALQRRDSGRLHLRLTFVSLSDRIKEIQLKLFPIINENGFVPRIKSPQSTQSTAATFALASSARSVFHHGGVQ